VRQAALFLRGLWWRRGFCAAVFVVGSITTAVAVLGPLYARAAGESTLSDRLTSSPSAATGMAFSQAALLTNPNVAAKAAAALPAPGSIRGYPQQILGVSDPITAAVPGEIGTSSSSLVWRAGACAHLIVISGHCPTSAGQAIVDDNALHATPNWKLGDQLSIYFGDASGSQGPSLDRLTIVGSYRPINTADPYWFGLPYFNAHLAPVAIPDEVDAVFVQESEFQRTTTSVPGQVNVDYPLDTKQVNLSSVARLLSRVDAVQAEYPTYGTGPGTAAMQTGLPSVLAAARADQRQVDVDTLLVIAELAVLSWLVLFHIVADAIEARGNEVALAKLRGLRPRAVLAFAIGEPLLLLAVSLPFGVLLATGVVHLLAAHVLVAGTPVVIRAPVAAAVAIAFAGSAIAAFIAGRRILTRPVLEQWRNTSSGTRPHRGLLVVDLALALAAVGGLILIRTTSNHDSPRSVTLLAPGLLVFAVATVGVRLLPPLGRTRLSATRGSRRIGLFLALRQMVRRPAGLRLAALLAVAAGLASFAVAGESVAHGNRIARAQTEVGAPTVAAVQFQPNHDPQTVVSQIDPDQKWAMATATWVPDGAAPSAGGAGIVGPVLAIEPSRLPAVAYSVRGQMSMTAIASAVTVPSAKPAMFTGTQLRVRVDALSITGAAPLVGLRTRQAHQILVSTRTTALAPGVHDYVADVDCASGCAYAGVTWERPAGEFDAEHASVVVSAVQAFSGGSWHDVPAPLNIVQQWRGDNLGGDASSTITATADGLRDDFSSGLGSSALLVYADSPARVPVVATPAAVTGSGLLGAMLDYTATQSDFAVRAKSGALPAVTGTGAVADLDYLRIQLPDFDYEANWSVWLGANAPPDALSRLQAAGLIVESVQKEQTRVNVLGRQAPALALLLLLVCAIAASVLAVGGTAITLSASGRRRSFELAALRAIGVSRGSLRRACVLEQLMLLGASLVLGVPAGVVISWLVMPAIPEFSDSTPVHLIYDPPALPILAFTAGFAVLWATTAVIAGTSLARAAVPARLREVEQ